MFIISVCFLSLILKLSENKGWPKKTITVFRVKLGNFCSILKIWKAHCLGHWKMLNLSKILLKYDQVKKEYFPKKWPFKFTPTKYVISRRGKECFGAKFTKRDHFYIFTGYIQKILDIWPLKAFSWPFLVEKWQFLEFYSINLLIVSYFQRMSASQFTGYWFGIIIMDQYKIGNFTHSSEFLGHFLIKHGHF